MTAPTVFLPLAAGQRFRVNSFHLGFINIEPVDVVVEIRMVSNASNEMEVALLPFPGESTAVGYAQIDRWYRDGYAACTQDNCLLKNARAFEQLIYLQVAVCEQRLTLSSLAPVTTLRVATRPS
jgi:hypothetical protein